MRYSETVLVLVCLTQTSSPDSIIDKVMYPPQCDEVNMVLNVHTNHKAY